MPGFAASLAAVAMFAIPAQAAQQIDSFSVTTSNTEAGAHPDLKTSFTLEDPGQPEVAKNITVNLPAGLFGNPQAISTCTSANFALNECPSASQAGLVSVRGNHESDPEFLFGTAPLYNLLAQGDSETTRLVFVVPILNIPIAIPITVRTGSDYGLQLKVTGITQQIPLAGADVTVWGFPADTEHDSQRFRKGTPGSPQSCPGIATPSCLKLPFPTAAITVHPFIDNPTICTGEPLTVSLDVQTYQDPANPTSKEAALPPTTECEKQKFEPFLDAGLTSEQTDSPSGLDLRFRAEQFLGFANSPSQLRSVTAILPEGLTINPDAADGQSACLDSQANFGNDLPGNCPDNSKIGTVEVLTPALKGPLVGSLYFGEPKPGDQYRVFMIFDGFGIHAKLFASVKPDPRTGQLTISVIDLPQVPFEEFNLHLFASDRGLVATPIHCSLYQVDSLFVPWNDQLAPQQSRPNLGLTSGPNGEHCPGQLRPFEPRLIAGMSTPGAGAFSSFHLKLERDDGDQFLGDLNFRMPPGFTGDLRGISYCPDSAIAAAAQNRGIAEQAAGSCPASSQIGTTNVAAGPGSHPFHATGKMYLAGPLKGAPLSLVAVTPALAGPYDYGVVVIRVALHVDPQTAQVSAVSERMPQIIGGVPIRMRSIQVNIDKPKFTINPTHCSPSSVDSQGIGDQGTVTDFSSYFQAVNCATLPFKPSMTVRQVGGRKATRRAANPALRFDLRTRPADANIKSLSVTLPNAFNIDQRHLGNICSEKELIANQCAGRTPIGQAVTTTPLLDQPLSGPAYAVTGSGGLPRLAFILNGQVTLIPRAETKTTPGGLLQTTVPVVPDAPIGHFALTVFGGKTGYLINTRNICKRAPIVRVLYVAQSGRTRAESPRVRTACSGTQKRRARR
jgi:hypothetical protein